MVGTPQKAMHYEKYALWQGAHSVNETLFPYQILCIMSYSTVVSPEPDTQPQISVMA